MGQEDSRVRVAASAETSDADRALWQSGYQFLRRGRDQLLGPFAALLVTLRVPASAVSAGSVALAATTLWTLPNAPRLALLGVLGPLLLDALDGAVARRSGTASPRGKLVDHLCDSAVFAILLTAFALHRLALPALAVFAAYTTLLVVVLAMALRCHDDAEQWRGQPQAGFGAHLPKLFFFIAAPLHLLGGPHWIDPALATGGLVATLFALLYFRRLLQSWQPNSSGDP